MYSGKYEKPAAKKNRGKVKRTVAVSLSLLLLLTAVVGGTITFIVDKTPEKVNYFKPSEVTCEVTEEFDGEVKSNVNVTNTGNIDAYIRVKLLSHRQNASGQIIGGTVDIPAFTPGTGWVKYGDHYYYTSPVAPGGEPAADLIDAAGITLENYNFQFYGGKVTQEELEKDPDAKPYGIKSGRPGGGVQVIEVVAEAIQAEGVDETGKHPVEIAWLGITVNADGTLNVPGA